MKRELELFLRNKNLVSQHAGVDKQPRRFMVGGVWCTLYTIHIDLNLSGLGLIGEIRNFADGNVETKLLFSTYGDCRMSPGELTRREKIINHIEKYGATYTAESTISWFN